MRFWLTFLPEQERTLQPAGIHLFGLRYWSAALSADVGSTDRRLLVKCERYEQPTLPLLIETAR
ncbi:Mu transposase C-terminal domain-containing protein (plasmid) [Sinorhizobium medicae]|uniref:Mu transposase C-terminal domain-containing protein n=1 Tax=Sinorhizobium medicae TaxID=110321 RepID=UPI001F3BC99C|nr:Mu transposase C-terminal domain-containing protein [Sinorhizobium medicae]